MQVNIIEALRYLGASGGDDSALYAAAQQQAALLEKACPPRWRYRVFGLERRENGFLVSGSEMILAGKSAETMLESCDSIALLACTLGAPFDALLRREQARDMSQAVILDACGSAYVESGCDAAEEELRSRFPEKYLTDRFSPGYGDLQLDLQPQLCGLLDARRQLGLSVTESFLLNPTKSVTALIGLSARPQRARIRGCAHCSMKEICEFRKRGMTCGI